MSNHSKLKQLRHTIENSGWDVVDDRLEADFWARRSFDCPAWKLTSRWPPLGYQLHLEVHGDRIVAPRSWTAPNVLSFRGRFTEELQRFVDGLGTRRREAQAGCVGQFSILGVAIGDTKSMVEVTHGNCSLEGPYYVSAFLYPRGTGKRDFERLQCVYNELTVTYYQDEGDLVVCQVFGPQLELQANPYLFAGEQIDDSHQIFAREAERYPRSERPPLRQGWNEFNWGNGALRVDGSGAIREFRLGSDGLARGRSMVPLPKSH